jgi:hypothetical protein
VSKSERVIKSKCEQERVRGNKRANEREQQVEAFKKVRECVRYSKRVGDKGC